MTPAVVTPDQIATVAGITKKHVMRVISEFQGAGPYATRHEWHGARLDISVMECGVEISFASLPEHIREAFVMLEQPKLPFTPPPSRNKLN